MKSLGVQRALLSVTDKTGLVELARELVRRDVQLYASGGTAAHLQAAGIDATPVEELTRFPALLEGRLKTLHPGLLAGILADKESPSHRDDLQAHGLVPMDLVVVNFYAFAAAAAQGDLPIEAIDIGGPTLVRAAAKNFGSVVVLTAPADYAEFLEAFAAARVDLDLRRRLAARAFARVADYDRIIAQRFGTHAGAAATMPSFQAHRFVPGPPLRYGENPHQRAAAWLEQPAWGLGALQQLGGESLSYNNLVDADAACDLVFDLGGRPACAIIKHNNACGAALGETTAAAFEAALACDPISAYGGVVACNFIVDAEAAAAMTAHFFEVLCAPSFSPAAKSLLGAKKRLRLLEVPRDAWHRDSPSGRALHGAWLEQEPDLGLPELARLEVVTRKEPTPEQREDASFLAAVAKHVRSNAIVLGRERRTLGIGAGQMSRVDSCDLAVRKAAAAGHDVQGSVAASDAFFPFPDGVERLAAAGVRVILQPGGSKRDTDVVAAADRLGLCMLVSGRRHFRH